MGEMVERFAEKVREKQQSKESDYRDEQGILWCSICGERKENIFEIMGQKKILPCMCRCDLETWKTRMEEERRKEFALCVHGLKAVGLTESRFRDWCFENDNGSNPKLNIARMYVENWKEMQKQNIGYVVMGPVGTGKSFFAGCIANALLEQGIRVMMTNSSRILNELTKPYADKNEIIADLVSYPLLIIDDFGIERGSPFALEMIYNIIDRRYCSKRPLIVTTNLSYQDMTRPDLDLEHQRIYSRLMEMCLPVVCTGRDQRMKEQGMKLEWLKLQNK